MESRHTALRYRPVLWSHVRSPCSAGLFRLLAFIFVLITSLIFIRSYISLSMKTIRLPRWLGECSSLLGQGLWTRAEG